MGASPMAATGGAPVPHIVGMSSIALINGDFSARPASDFKIDVDSLGRQDLLHAARPFDHHDAVLIEQLAESDGEEIVCAADAIGIEVIDREQRGLIDV